MVNPEPQHVWRSPLLQRALEPLDASPVTAAKEIAHHRRTQDEADRDAILRRLVDLRTEGLRSAAGEPEGPVTSGIGSGIDLQQGLEPQHVADVLAALVELADNDHAQGERRDAEAEIRHEEAMAIAKAGAWWVKIAALAALVGIPTTLVVGYLVVYILF